MELIKPEPLIIGGRAHYTLTSYDPVAVEVDVPYTTDEDVEYMLQIMVLQSGGTLDSLSDEAWIKEHFDDAASAAELRAAARDAVQSVNAQMAEQQKVTRCASALAERLAQRVPQGQVAQTRTALMQSLMIRLQQDGMSESDFLARSGMRHSDLEAMLDEQAEEAAKEEAAIDAWAEHQRLTVVDEELPSLLGIMPSDADQFLASMRASGRLEEARRAALRSKAMETIVAECVCNYVHETPAEAAVRIAHMQPEQQAILHEMSKANQASASTQDDGKHPHLKLV